jgi:uncharacterized UPF0160 family protein
LTYFIKVVEIKPEIKKSNRELRGDGEMDIKKDINVLMKSLSSLYQDIVNSYPQNREERDQRIEDFNLAAKEITNLIDNEFKNFNEFKEKIEEMKKKIFKKPEAKEKKGENNGY